MKTGRWMLGLFALLTIAAADADGGTGGADGGPDAQAPRAPAFPEEKTPRPKDADWEGVMADQIDIKGLPSGCSALRIEEWVRVRCGSTLASIGLVGGDRTDVSVRMDPVNEDFLVPASSGGEMVFPVRRGDRRLFEWVAVEFGYKGMTSTGPLFVLSEVWLPGDDTPALIAANPSE
jgi:hypothetical protein